MQFLLGLIHFSFMGSRFSNPVSSTAPDWEPNQPLNLLQQQQQQQQHQDLLKPQHTKEVCPLKTVWQLYFTWMMISQMKCHDPGPTISSLCGSSSCLHQNHPPHLRDNKSPVYLLSSDFWLSVLFDFQLRSCCGVCLNWSHRLWSLHLWPDA